MDQTISTLATFAADATYDELPAEVAEHAVVRLVDSLGCAVGGVDSPQARIALSVSPAVAANGDLSSGRILASSRTTTPELAVFANTCMIRNLDFNDRYPHLHPSDMIGALVAAATVPGVDGKRLVSAIVTAYEVAIRVSDAAKMRTGWDQGYAVGLGTVAGLGNLLAASAETLREALSIIATANVHLRSTRAGLLSNWKGAATAYATSNAMFAFRLAQAGMTGPESPIEGRHGLWEQITGPFVLAAFPRDGGGYLIGRSSLKYWPVEFSAQTAVWAGAQLAQQIAPDDLGSVRLGAHKHGWHEIGSEPAKWDPQTRETADHSMPYIFAKAMQKGSVDLSIFEPEQYLDAALRPLMAKIKVEPDDACEQVHPDGIMLTCDATSKDGRAVSFAVRDPKGFWTNPMDWSQVQAKFTNLTEPAYGAATADQLFQFWRGVAEHADLAPGLDLLTPETD